MCSKVDYTQDYCRRKNLCYTHQSQIHTVRDKCSEFGFKLVRYKDSTEKERYCRKEKQKCQNEGNEDF